MESIEADQIGSAVRPSLSLLYPGSLGSVDHPLGENGENTPNRETGAETAPDEKRQNGSPRDHPWITLCRTAPPTVRTNDPRPFRSPKPQRSVKRTRTGYP